MSQSQRIQKNLKTFIRVDTKDPTQLRLNFDGLCKYLIDQESRKFSPKDFEKALVKQLKKVEGHEISPDVFNAIAKYIDEKTLWLQNRQIKEKQLRLEEMSWVNEVKTPEGRRERMAEVYRNRSERDPDY